MRASTAVQSLLRIRPGEFRRTGSMFVLLLLLVGSFILGRIVRDTLFLDLPNIKAQLPIMYVAVALLMAFVSTVLSRLQFRGTRFMVIAILVMVASLFVARVLIDRNLFWFPYAFYGWIDLFGSLMILQFWTFANELFNAREAKRLFAVVGGGGVIANIVIGVGVGQNAKRLGVANLLFVLIAMLLLSLAALLVARRGQSEGVSKEVGPSKGRGGGAAAVVFGSRYLTLLALTTLCTFLVTTLGDYEFKLIVSETISDRDGRAAYFGSFYAVTGVLSAFVQFFLTSRILERVGILPALLLLPGSLLMSGLVIIVSPVLWAASLLKGSETTLRYTINDSTSQLLYLPISKEARAKAKAFVEGILKPMAIALAGLGLFLLAPVLKHQMVAGALVAVTVVWLGLLVVLRTEYLKTLLLTLKQRRLDFDGVSYHATDEGTLKTFRATLGHGSPEEILTVLDLLSTADLPSMQTEALVLPLLRHADDDVKMAALDYFGKRGRPELAGPISTLFDGHSEPVRAAAIGAFCHLAKDDAAMVLERFLDDPSLLIQGATVAGLIKNGGLEGVLTAADQLKAMIDDKRPEVRERAAWVLGEISVSGFYRPLITLMTDGNEAVQSSAISSAAKLKSPKLLGPLLELLKQDRSIALVVEALQSYGPTIESEVLVAFYDATQPLSAREALCRVLQRIGGAASVKGLTSDFTLTNDRLRTLALATALRICLRDPSASPNAADIAKVLDREASGFCQALIIEKEIGDVSELLTQALRARVEDALSRLFSALGFVYPQKTLEVVAANLQSSDQNVRANAVEVLDNLLQPQHKALILPLLDDALLKEILVSGHKGLTLFHLSRLEWIESLLRDSEEWLVVSALHAVGLLRARDLEESVSKCLDHPDSWVRETALWTLRAIVDGEALSGKAGKLIGDNVGRVRHFGEHVLAELAMISNVEKVLFLRKIDLFRRIRGDDLARIANIAEELSFDKNEQVFAEGEVGEALYLIVSGKVKIHKGEVKLAELGDRQCFGEISILDSEPRSASVTAIEPLLTLKIKRDDFSEIMTQKPEIAQGVIKVLCGRLRNANKR